MAQRATRPPVSCSRSRASPVAHQHLASCSNDAAGPAQHLGRTGLQRVVCVPAHCAARYHHRVDEHRRHIRRRMHRPQVTRPPAYFRQEGRIAKAQKRRVVLPRCRPSCCRQLLALHRCWGAATSPSCKRDFCGAGPGTSASSGRAERVPALRLGGPQRPASRCQKRKSGCLLKIGMASRKAIPKIKLQATAPTRGELPSKPCAIARSTAQSPHHEPRRLHAAHPRTECPPGACVCDRDALLQDPRPTPAAAAHPREKKAPAAAAWSRSPAWLTCAACRDRMDSNSASADHRPGPNEVRTLRGITILVHEQRGLCRKTRSVHLAGGLLLTSYVARG